MNKLTYQMAITRHEELLRQAAEAKLAKQAASATNGSYAEAARRSRRRISAAATWRPTKSRGAYTPASR